MSGYYYVFTESNSVKARRSARDFGQYLAHTTRWGGTLQPFPATLFKNPSHGFPFQDGRSFEAQDPCNPCHCLKTDSFWFQHPCSPLPDQPGSEGVSRSGFSCHQNHSPTRHSYTIPTPASFPLCRHRGRGAGLGGRQKWREVKSIRSRDCSNCFYCPLCPRWKDRPATGDWDRRAFPFHSLACKT